MTLELTCSCSHGSTCVSEKGMMGYNQGGLAFALSELQGVQHNLNQAREGHGHVRVEMHVLCKYDTGIPLCIQGVSGSQEEDIGQSKKVTLRANAQKQSCNCTGHRPCPSNSATLFLATKTRRAQS